MVKQSVWVAIDWGTTHMRGWVLRGNQKIADLPPGVGMNSLSPDQFEAELARVLAGHMPGGVKTPVVICGMAGAQQGWKEAPYCNVPCPPTDLTRAIRVETRDPNLDVHILPGLCQNLPAEVMRGEETQIAGYLIDEPEFDGVLCLPGTHTKWVHISAGEVVSFRTAMTGELFGLLAQQSVLRHSVSGTQLDKPAFLSAVDDAMSRPANLAADLFGIRANALVNGTGAEIGRARLSGLLIGAELASMRPYWLGQRVVLIGDASISHCYQDALAAQGAMVELSPTQDLTLKGLNAAYNGIRGQR